MTAEIGQAGAAGAEFGIFRPAIRKIGTIIPGAVAIAGIMAITAPPAAAAEEATPPEKQTAAALTELPSLGRHVRRAARLPFNVSLKFDEEDATAAPAARPSLARFVRARGHGSDATAVDSLGPDRLVESLTFPSEAPESRPATTALADVKDAVKDAPGL